MTTCRLPSAISLAAEDKTPKGLTQPRTTTKQTKRISSRVTPLMIMVILLMVFASASTSDMGADTHKYQVWPVSS